MNDHALNSLEAGVSPLGIGAEVGKLRRILFLVFLIALTTAGSCNSETLFKSNFDATAVEQPPAQQQAVGTATIDGGVRVAVIPGTNSKGARFNRISGSNSALLQCELSKPPTDGTYVFSTALFFPSQSGGLVTIEFVGGGQRFMHLDFPLNSVRIDDDASTTFGTFQRDQLFIVQVTLKINETPSAHIVLSGAGASGEANRDVSPPFRPFARQFNAVRISSGLQADDSTFFATNILVTRKS